LLNCELETIELELEMGQKNQLVACLSVLNGDHFVANLATLIGTLLMDWKNIKYISGRTVKKLSNISYPI